MANITLNINSNWSTCSDGNNTGSAPGATDNIYLNGYSLTLDGALPATFTCANIKAVASDGTTPTAGTVVVNSGTTTIVGNLYAGGAVLLSQTTGKHVVLTGNATGGTGNNIHCVSVGTANFSCVNANGGSGNGAAGVVAASTAASITISGISTGGSGINSHGCYASIGTWSVASAKGGTHASACGVGLNGSGSGAYPTVTIAAIDNTGTGPAVGAGVLKLADGCVLQYADAAGTAKKFYGADLMPAAGDVQDSVSYGGTDFLGTLVLPTEAQVEDGVGFGADGTEFEGTLAGGGGNVIVVD